MTVSTSRARVQAVLMVGQVHEIATILFITTLAIALALVVVPSRHLSTATTRQVALTSCFGWVLVAIFFPIAARLAKIEATQSKLALALWLAGQIFGALWDP